MNDQHTPDRTASSTLPTVARLLSVALLCVIFSLMLGGPLGMQTLEASASSSAGHNGIDEPGTEYRPWLKAKPSTPDELLSKVSQGLEANEPVITAKRAYGVEAGRPLRLDVRVSDENGMPVNNAEVVIAWRDRDAERYFTRYTDKNGMTSLTRWVGAGEKGHVNTCVVWADTREWTGSDYVWFVPE